MRHVPDNPVFRKDEYEARLLLQKPKFQDSVEALRKKWDIPAEGFFNNLQDAWQADLADDGLDEYHRDISLLLRELGLTERWHDAVSNYIQLNAPSVLKLKPYDPIKVEYDVEGNIESLWIQVDKDTTRQEVTEAFKNAQDMLGSREKKQPPDNLDRDLALLELHRDGYKNKELAAWLNENYKGAFNTEDVKAILKRIKRRLS